VVADAEVAARRRATRNASPKAHRWWRAGTSSSRAVLPIARPLTEAEYDECFACFDSEDFRIGYAAFLAKQKPGFRRTMSGNSPRVRSPACACCCADHRPVNADDWPAWRA